MYVSSDIIDLKAFKIRGATNAVLSLLESNGGEDPSSMNVITHSSGNHAQALALASRQVGANCQVVMPSTAPSVKKAAVKGYGALVTECQPTLEAREATTNRIRDEIERSSSGKCHIIPPYDDPRIIAGQGTAALELFEQAKELGRPLDVLLTPVGGGGLLSGCALTAKGLDPSVVVIGAEPLGESVKHPMKELDTYYCHRCGGRLSVLYKRDFSPIRRTENDCGWFTDILGQLYVPSDP